MNWKLIVLTVAGVVVGAFGVIGLLAFAVGMERWAAGVSIQAPPNYLTDALNAPDLGEPGQALALRYVKAAEAHAVASAQIATELHHMRSAIHIVACTEQTHSDMAYMLRRYWLSCSAYGKDS